MSRNGSIKHLAAMSVVAVLLSGILFFVFSRIDIIPHSFSVERHDIDTFLRIMFAIASVFFSVIVTAFVYSLIFFRRRRGENGYGALIKGNSTLELTWTAIPLAIVIGLSIAGSMVLTKMDEPAKPLSSELQVDVLAVRFAWSFSYPQYGNVSSFELQMPVNRRVHFFIQSKDVVHSFWIQELGPKQDAVPGLTSELYITPTKTGNYLVQCSQLCGSGHTYMTAPASVVSESDFDNWIRQQKPAASPSPAPTGVPVSVNLTAKNIAFDVKTITVAAGAAVTVNFDNQDASVEHNFAVYMDSAATMPIFVGKIITGPAQIAYSFTAPGQPGTYFFRCDVHPTMMRGTFVVR